MVDPGVAGDASDVAKSYYPGNTPDGVSLVQPFAGEGAGGFGVKPAPRPVWGRRLVPSPLNQRAGAYTAAEGWRKVNRGWLKRTRKRGSADVAYGVNMSGRLL
jgi:hypothetical protein